MVNFSPRLSSKGLDEALPHPSIPLLPCQVTLVSSLIGLSDAKKLKVKSRNNRSKKNCRWWLSVWIRKDSSNLSCPSISTPTDRPSKLIYTKMSAVITGFMFSSSQHECRINFNNISQISRESQSASQEHVARHALWKTGKTCNIKGEWGARVTDFTCESIERYGKRDLLSLKRGSTGRKVTDHYRSKAKCYVKLNNLTFPFW